jgi:putative flippase GtrA
MGSLAGAIVNYLLSVRFVFRSGVRFSRHQEVALVFAVSLVGLAINQLVLYIGIEHALAEMMLSKIGATAIAFLWNFAARNNFVFKGKS